MSLLYRDDSSLSEAYKNRGLLLRTSPERGVIARRLFSFIVVFVLSLSSFAIISSSILSSASGASTDASRITDSYEYPASSHSWDWSALADSDGYVDVIVFLPSDFEDLTPLAKAAQLASASALKAQSDVTLESSSPVRTFTHTLNGFSARVDLDTIESLLQSDPYLSIYPDLTLNATITDGVRNIGADKVWTMTDSLGVSVTGVGIVVAVIDTGIDYMHPDLGGGIGPSYKVIGGYDFVNDDVDPMDDNGHGTHVAGTIAADGDVPGVAPGAKLLAYKALGASGSGSMSDVIEAIDMAMDPDGDGSMSDHADIISMSLGGAGGTDDPVCQAVERAVEAGVVVVVAAGNEGPSLGTVATPGLAPSAITVGAVDDDGNIAPFSSRGPTPEMNVKPEISAPGVDILSTVPFSGTVISSPTGYASLSGTSMATPHVSGAVALLLQLHPDWTPSFVKSAVVSGAMLLNESLWTVGAGGMWVPGAAEATMFSSVPLVSYGLAGSSSQAVSITNTGSSASFTISTIDFFSLTANGSLPEQVQTDLSSSSPASVSIPSGDSETVTLTVDIPTIIIDEGYYAGTLELDASSGHLIIPFGFVVLSTLNVHVFDMSGREVFDPYGGVWVYDLPDASFAMGYRGMINAVPPATFFLPSGSYAVHSMGHQLLYTYSDAYVLSDTVDVGLLQTIELNIYMADAHEVTLDLETDGGQPIYVKDYRVYCRYEGSRNISFDLTGSDYSIVGSEVFAIPHSMTLYVSDTTAEIGISIAGFAYTPDMWDFMSLNWQHWYEFTSGTSTAFMVEASADLQYLLAWEFDSVDTSMPSTLTWEEDDAAVFETKYDIPGTISDPWCNWGTHRAMGGDATFYVRRDTDTSLNPFFSGLTRTTVVTGTFSELYFPRSVMGGYSERQFFVADYDYVLEAAVAAGIYIPDRNYVTPLDPQFEEQRLGSGPFYPSLFTENTDDSMILYHPLLRDQSGARVGGTVIPSMNLYRDGGLVGIYQLSEYLARPDAQRVVNLFGDGSYVAKISYSPTSEISKNVAMELGFSVPSVDRDPPMVTGLEMSQRFVPGSAVALSLDVIDTMSSVTVDVSWRTGSTDSWKSLTVSSADGKYNTSIQTTTATASIDLMIVITDSYSNYMSAVITSASLPEIPVVFELAPKTSTVEYRDATVAVTLEGQLTDISGNPLSSTAAVPIELYSGDRKVAMLLDEYVQSTTHTHNGQILFQWLLNPTSLFTGTGQNVQFTATFDLGIYEVVTITFSLTSVLSDAVAPVIELVSPGDGSLIASGAVIDLDVIDDGLVDVLYSVDGGSYVTLAEPWDISTSSWSDAVHSLAVTVMDDDGFTVTASYSFDVDASSPELEIVQPVMASEVPIGFSIVISVSDSHLSTVEYSVDDSEFVTVPSPYVIDMTGWTIGMHVVVVAAMDAVGHESTTSVYFEIVNATLVALLASPEDGSYINSGTPLQILVYSSGNVTCSWSAGGPWSILAAPYVISTEGWGEDDYFISVSAADDLGGSSEFSFSFTIDDTPPEISLLWPEVAAFVTPDDLVSIQVTDEHLDFAVWSVLGISETTSSGTFTVSLSSVDIDGSFSMNVFAYDLADNTAEDSIAFTMDLYAPVVGIVGLATGQSIMDGEDMVLQASDSHLKNVTLSFDGGDAVAGYPGMIIETDALTLGWHSLVLIATDMSGRVAVNELSIYIDGTPPEAQLIGSVEFVIGATLTLTVTATDDFGIAEGVVYYELEAGGYDSMPMTLSGSELAVTLPSNVLWDGMDVYVSVYDLAGNVADSEHVSAVEVGSLSSDSDGSWFASIAGIISISSIIVAVVILVLFMMNRGRSEARRSYRDISPRRPSSARETVLPEKEEADESSSVPADAAIIDEYEVIKGRPWSHGRQTIIENIPNITSSAGIPGPVATDRIMVKTPEAQDEEDIDYGALIERELLQGVLSRSVFRDAAPEINENASPELISPEDRIISAMKLKKLMDDEEIDDDSIF